VCVAGVSSVLLFYVLRVVIEGCSFGEQINSTIGLIDNYDDTRPRPI